MSWKPNQVFLPDLSHYEWPSDLNTLAAAGCVAVIWKATQGTGYQDPTYNQARAAAYAAGLLWGAYHFADSSDADKQVNNFLAYATPTGDDLICLDFEDYQSNSMSLSAAQQWIQKVEDTQGRPNQCVLYSGNRIKEQLGNKLSEFWSSHRLWLCQYGNTPNVPAAWADTGYWLWQFTDGLSGPTPHTVAGVSGPCDVNAFDGTEDQLKSEWAGGTPSPPPPPEQPIVTVTIDVPAGVTVNVIQNVNSDG